MVKHTQTIRQLKPTNSLSAFDHFVGLVLQELTRSFQRLIQQFQSKILKASRESILKSIQSKIIKECVKDSIRYDFSFNSPFKVTLQFNSFLPTHTHTHTHTHKFFAKQTFINISFKYSSISFQFFHSFIHFKLTWIGSLSNLSNLSFFLKTQVMTL